MVSVENPASVRSYQDIRGWFHPIDHALFRAILESQQASPPGDLVELGAYLGKSAVVIGDYLRPQERFVVVDLFGSDAPLDDSGDSAANRVENQRSYRRLTREAFEANYLALHEQLPHVVQGLSSQVVDHVAPGSARFLHVDASHLYHAVAEDCRSAGRLLRPGGVVAFDDYRSVHCPGVAAAVWEAAARGDLVPVAATPMKLYAVASEPEQALEVVRATAAELADDFFSEDVDLLGTTIVRFQPRRRQKRRRPGRPGGAPAAPPPPAARSWRRLVADELAPPALTRWVRSRRR